MNEPKHIKQRELITLWVQKGLNNPWIRQVGSGNPEDDCAFEPRFSEEYFHECKTIKELIEKFKHGNWILGQAFYYKNICFINQINGGDEWLTLRNNIAFESISAEVIIAQDGEQAIYNFIDDVLAATDDQLRNLTYSRERCMFCNTLVDDANKVELQVPRLCTAEFRKYPATDSLHLETRALCTQCDREINWEELNNDIAEAKQDLLWALEDNAESYNNDAVLTEVQQLVSDSHFLLKEHIKQIRHYK